MKRILHFILVLAFIFALGSPVLADDVTITASVSEAYVIKIPAATTNLTWGITTAQTFGTIGLQSAKLIPGHQVNIAVSGNDGLANNVDGSKKIIYQIKDGSDVFTEGNFTDTTLKTLTIVVEQAQWDAAPAGSYSDIITFTATVTDIAD